MSFAAAAAELVTTLEDAGLRVAVRDGDLTPPVVYIPHLGNMTDAGGPLNGSRVATFYVYVIPIRGPANLTADADTLDRVYDALTPITWADLTGAWSSVTVGSDTWPCYRLDVALAGLDALTERTSNAHHR